VTGFVAGDTQASATSGSESFSSATLAKTNVGSYGVTGSGLSANNGNYIFLQAPGNAKALTIISSDQNQSIVVASNSIVNTGASSATINAISNGISPTSMVLTDTIIPIASLRLPTRTDPNGTVGGGIDEFGGSPSNVGATSASNVSGVDNSANDGNKEDHDRKSSSPASNKTSKKAAAQSLPACT
ncbi:MAG: hypothetical protein H7252_02310, partial [Cytophaga sp.]|nr:hypothetical protein [Undibacterium sp.]